MSTLLAIRIVKNGFFFSFFPFINVLPSFSHSLCMSYKEGTFGGGDTIEARFSCGCAVLRVCVCSTGLVCLSLLMS